MTSQRTAKAIIEHCLPGHVVSNDSELRIVDVHDFQLVGESQCSARLPREISDFLDMQDTAHPFQWPQWSGSGARLALLRRQGRLQWFAQCGVLYPAGRVLRPIRALTVNRGPVCDDLELMEIGLRELVRKSREMGIAYIDIAPEWTGTYAESAGAMLARNGWQSLPGVRSSLRLDLRPTLADLFARFRKTTRYEIRRSEVEGIKVTVAYSDTDHHEFLRLYLEMANQKQFPADDSAFLLHVFRWLATDPRRGGLFVAREDGKLRGGAVIVRSGARCWYVLAATSKEGKINAGHLLQWRAIQWAKEAGCLEYDFGGFRESVSSGPALFKRGFCDRVVHFLPPHRHVVSQGRHRMAEIISEVRRSVQRAPKS